MRGDTSRLVRVCEHDASIRCDVGAHRYLTARPLSRSRAWLGLLFGAAFLIGAYSPLWDAMPWAVGK